jgi:hypothetical protein
MYAWHSKKPSPISAGRSWRLPAADYVRRGRHHALLELKREWVCEFRGWVTGLCNGPSIDRRIHEDFESELRVRQIEPPWEVVRQDIEKMREAMQARMRRLVRDNPAKFAQQRRKLDEALEEFLQSSERPNGN